MALFVVGTAVQVTVDDGLDVLFPKPVYGLAWTSTLETISLQQELIFAGLQSGLGHGLFRSQHYHCTAV
jgi:hypothetical protein